MGGDRCVTTELLVGPESGIDEALVERPDNTMLLGDGEAAAAVVVTLS